MKACESGNMEICIALLQNGCDPFLADKNNRKADEYAAVNHPDKNIH